jgi:hypothetical protein
MFIWRRVTRQCELLAQVGQTSALFILNQVTRHLLHDCRNIDAEMAPKHKKELAKVSYSAASCKQSPGITISFYNSRDLAVAE